MLSPGLRMQHTRDEMLVLSDMTVCYGSLEILHGISLEVREHEIVALLGANGAGKTTAISAIAGLLPVRSGAVSFRGADITDRPAERIVRHGLVQVPEGRRIFPGLTVRENLDMGAYAVRDAAASARSLERAYALFPKLSQRRNQRGGTLSGGEQQMLAIARGLMSEPAMLLLDEPSLGLAPIVVDQIFEIILAIRAGGTTVLLVEQNAQRSLEIADRGYILETGTIALADTGAALLANEKVRASYLGA
jgi:branched-chain amino acid transport system ATP-binding protein